MSVMLIEQDVSEVVSLLRLRVVSEADPGAFLRVLEPFRNINVIPRRFIAEYGTAETIHMELDVVGFCENHLARIAEKLAQLPCIQNAHWYRI